MYTRTTENKHVPFAHQITTPDMNIDPSPALRQGTAAPAPPPPFPRTPRRRNPANRMQNPRNIQVTVWEKETRQSRHKFYGRIDNMSGRLFTTGERGREEKVDKIKHQDTRCRLQGAPNKGGSHHSFNISRRTTSRYQQKPKGASRQEAHTSCVGSLPWEG